MRKPAPTTLDAELVAAVKTLATKTNTPLEHGESAYKLLERCLKAQGATFTHRVSSRGVLSELVRRYVAVLP